MTTKPNEEEKENCKHEYFLEKFNDETGEALMKCCKCGDEYIKWKVEKEEDDQLDSESEMHKRMADSESENLKNVKPEDIPR